MVVHLSLQASLGRGSRLGLCKSCHFLSELAKVKPQPTWVSCLLFPCAVCQGFCAKFNSLQVSGRGVEGGRKWVQAEKPGKAVAGLLCAHNGPSLLQRQLLSIASLWPCLSFLVPRRCLLERISASPQLSGLERGQPSLSKHTACLCAPNGVSTFRVLSLYALH